MSWIEENAVAVIGWVGTLIMFAFVFGRRLSRLEATDTALAKSIDTLSQTQKDLSKTVEVLALNVNGHKGTLALAESLERLSDSLQGLGQRVTSNEERLAMHEVQLAKLGEMRLYLANQFTAMTNTMADMKTSLTKLEIRTSVLDSHAKE